MGTNNTLAVLGASFFIALAGVDACSADEPATDYDLEILDANGDGKEDAFYEFNDDGSYAQLADTNFDGKIDERCEFSKTDALLRCWFDQDFDFKDDTYIEYQSENAIRSFVDKDSDGNPDIIFHFSNGVLTTGFQLYSNNDGTKELGTVEFEFGYPRSESRLATTLSSAEFAKTYWDAYGNE